MELDLVLLRHGQSTWNAENRFTGWFDVDLSERGEQEAREAGQALAAAEGLDLRVCHTSVLTRAIRTANIALDEAGRPWLPVRRHWRLNERHYGSLQGLDKKEMSAKFGKEQVLLWRRSYDTPPAPLPEGDERLATDDPRYRGLTPRVLPRTECLADVVERMVPYWEDAIVPDLFATAGEGGAVLVVAHHNSLRALCKHIQGISDEEIVQLELGTGIPYRYRLDEQLQVIERYPLGDPDKAERAAEEVRRQAG